jgi:hypothetical protein
MSDLKEMYLCDTRQVSYKGFVEFGRRIGLPDKIVSNLLQRFSKPDAKADEYIIRSYLSEELKEFYLTGYHR